MPAVTPDELVSAVSSAIAESGYTATLISRVRAHPRRFAVVGPHTQFTLNVYAWTLTFGGRPQLTNEYRIQMTSVRSPLQDGAGGPTVLLGYEPALKLFAGFDLDRHREFTSGSPSIQIDRAALRRADTEGLSFHRKSNDEIAVGIRPDMLIAYALNASVLHRSGRNGNVLRLLNRAVAHEEIPEREIAGLDQNRRRVVSEVRHWARDADFKRRVLFAYGNRCAVTGLQLRLVDAAHIVPVGAPGSVDHVQNGIALSPTYHRAYDAGLIYLDQDLSMKLNATQLSLIAALHLEGGIEKFREPLGPILLPPDAGQRPLADFIRRANNFRKIPQ